LRLAIPVPDPGTSLFPKDEALREMKAESYVGTTLWGSTGHPIGLISVICERLLVDSHRAEGLLQMVSLRAAVELERLDGEEALARINEELEARIRARMGELDQTLGSLRSSEEKSRHLFENLPEGFACAACRSWTCPRSPAPATCPRDRGRWSRTSLKPNVPRRSS